MTPIASIVIPAHNEQAVIERCLSALLAEAHPGEFEVVVAANGCTDDTVRLATGFSHDDVRVVQTDSASKIAALNLGESAVSVLPRVYLDADIVITTDTARALARELTESSGLAAAAPRLHVDDTYSSRPAKLYLRVWQALPVFQAGYVGSGCYALSADGRAAFDRFPEVTNDDQWINELFPRARKATLSGHRMQVAAPRSLRAIVRRSIRVSAGSTEITSATDSGHSTRAFLSRQLRRPANAPAITVFVFTQITVKLLAKFRTIRGNSGEWLRDETSRTSAPPTVSPSRRGSDQPQRHS